MKLKGINRVRKTLAGGAVVEIHYAGRGKGAPAFWRSDSGVKPGSPEYLAALAACAPAPRQEGTFRAILDGFTASQDFTSLSPRTRADMMTSIRHPKNGIDVEFGSAPAAAFNDARIRGVVLAWRDRIGGKVGDDRLRHLQRIVGWALDRGKVRANHLIRIRGVYRADRAGIVWTQDEITRFLTGCPEWCARILIAATETGLRPADLHGLTWAHVHKTPQGQRLQVYTRKRGQIASIPVTPAMQAVLDATPRNRAHILVNSDGRPFAHENQLGQAIRKRRDKLGLRKDLRLYDARGTAATRLLRAGATMQEMAAAMGWSLKTASDVVARYAALSPEAADGVLEKLRGA